MDLFFFAKDLTSKLAAAEASFGWWAGWADGQPYWWSQLRHFGFQRLTFDIETTGFDTQFSRYWDQIPYVVLTMFSSTFWPAIWEYGDFTPCLVWPWRVACFKGALHNSSSWRRCFAKEVGRGSCQGLPKRRDKYIVNLDWMRCTNCPKFQNCDPFSGNLSKFIILHIEEILTNYYLSISMSWRKCMEGWV